MGTFLLFPVPHFPTTFLKCKSKRNLHVPTLRSLSDTGEAGGREGEEATQSPPGRDKEMPEFRVWCLTPRWPACGVQFPTIPQVEGPRYQQVPLCSPRMGMSQDLMTGPWILS